MDPIESQASKFPLLANDFFRHLHKRSVLNVFLCGRKPGEDQRFDLRTQVARLLKNRMGCKAVLGEDIEDLRTPRIDRDHLTIEIQEAARSDLVIMFLGSPGTIAEVAAFASHQEINPKTVVFNDIRFKEQRSFINLGPLRLLDGRVIYYEEERQVPRAELIRQLDYFVGEKWFSRFNARLVGAYGLTYDQFLVLALIYALFPVRYRDIEPVFLGSQRSLRTTLRDLFDRKLVRHEEHKYIPNVPLRDLRFAKDCITDIAGVRLRCMGFRMRTEDAVADYRLVL